MLHAVAAASRAKHIRPTTADLCRKLFADAAFPDAP